MTPIQEIGSALWTCECGYESPIVRDTEKRYCVCGRTVPRDPTRPEPEWIPLSVRSGSRIVAWLWRRTGIGYDRARKLARWLP